MPRWGGPRGPTALLVEDDDDQAALATRALRATARVTRARSAAEAERHLAEAPFDVVVLDYRLPDGDGLAVLAVVRSRAPGTPVLMLTGHGSEALAMRALSLGASDYMQKGGGAFGELAARVRALLEARTASDADETRVLVRAGARTEDAVDPRLQVALEEALAPPLTGLALLDVEGHAIAAVLPEGCRTEALAAAARALCADALRAGRASDLAPARLRVVVEGVRATLVAASLPRGLVAVALVEPGRGRERALRDLDEALARLRDGVRRGEGGSRRGQG